MEAFRDSLRVGANILEMDIQVTKDRKFVVFHDQNLKRLCGVDARIKDFNYCQLPTHKKIVQLDESSYGMKLDTQLLYGDRKLKFPLLEDVFNEFTGVPINVELKSPDDESIEELCNLIEKFERKEITVTGCLKKSVAKDFSKKNNEIKLFLSLPRGFLLLISFFFGWLPFFQIQEKYLLFPMYTLAIKTLVA